MSMRYRARTILLILIWIILTAFVTFATLYYGYNRSVETANETIETSLLKVDKSIDNLITNEAKIRSFYEQTNASMGRMVPFLQSKGLEETVPSKGHLKKYAEILGANYIAVSDPDGKTMASRGELEKDRHAIEIDSSEQMLTLMTSADVLLPPEEDYTLFETPLKDGYTLTYQISNTETNYVQNGVFSWRAILENLTLPNEAYLVVVSQQDDTILVHPDHKKIGKSYKALGFKSKEDFLNAYGKPGENGIAYQKNLTTVLSGGIPLETLLSSDFNLLGKGSGYKEMQGMYVICNMPATMSKFYVYQQRGVLIVYILASLLVLCYILLRFRWQRRQEKTAATQDASDDTPRGSLFCFHYERAWSRRLLVCCIIIMVASFVFSVHLELLSSVSQLKIRGAQTKELTKEVKHRNQINRSALDSWYNDTNIKTADAISYILTRDDSLQTRKTLKELSQQFDVPEIYLFDPNGKLKVTNSTLDHIDLNEQVPPRMSSTFLPLLYGIPSNATTPVTDSLKNDAGDQEESSSGKAGSSASAEAQASFDLAGEEMIAYAGVSIRNDHDLSSGALGFATEPMQELWGSVDFLKLDQDTFDTTMELAEGAANIGKIIFSVSQLALIAITLLFLAICMVLFYGLGVLQWTPRERKRGRKRERRRGRKRKTPGGLPEEEEPQTSVDSVQRLDESSAAFTEGAAAIESTDGIPANVHDGVGGSTDDSPDGSTDDSPDGSTDESTDESMDDNSGTSSVTDHDDLFYSIYGKKQDWFFDERWHYDSTPLRQRTPEKQLFFIIKCILFILALDIFTFFVSQGTGLSENSMLRDVISGDWQHGFNLYAITATEMIIIVSVVLCMGIRRLIYFIARFSTARGETVCHLVYSIVAYAAVLVALYYSLSLFGVHTKTILAGAGILGIVISFGAQSTIADILSGMFLIFEDVIHVGDYVKVGDKTGIVKSIGVRMTKIQSYGTEISFNNADLKSMQNLSDSDARVMCFLPLSSSADLARVEKIIEKELPGINKRLSETGYLTEEFWYSDVASVDDSGMTLRFDGYCVPYRFGQVMRQMYGELIRMCQRNGIRFAVSNTHLDPVSIRAFRAAKDDVASKQIPNPLPEPANQPESSSQPEYGIRPGSGTPTESSNQPESGTQPESGSWPRSGNKGFIDKLIDKHSK